MPRCGCGTRVPIGRNKCDSCIEDNRKIRMKRRDRKKGEQVERASITKDWYADVMRIVYDRGLAASDVDELIGHKRGKYFAGLGWRLHQTGKATIKKEAKEIIERWMKE